MKKILLIMAISAAGLTGVKAQIAKGNLFIGTGLGTTTYNFGTYNFNYSDGNIKNQDQKNYSLDLSPQVGVFLTDHLIFGGALGLDYANNKSNFNASQNEISTSNVANNSTTFSVGPFLRYYFDPPASKTLFYIEGDASIGSGSGSTSETDYYTDNSNIVYTGTMNSMLVFKAGGSLGITHMIQKNIGLDFGIGYLYDYEKFNDNLNTQITTASGAVSNNTLSYKAKEPENGITVSAGFHFMVP